MTEKPAKDTKKKEKKEKKEPVQKQVYRPKQVQPEVEEQKVEIVINESA
jgi:hypothetical protein